MLFDGSLYRLFSENCTCSNLLNYWYSVTLVWQLDIKFARLAPTFPIKLRSFLPKYLVGTFFSILRKKTTKSTFDDWYLHLTVIMKYERHKMNIWSVFVKNFTFYGTYWFVKYKGSLRNTNFLLMYTNWYRTFLQALIKLT